MVRAAMLFGGLWLALTPACAAPLVGADLDREAREATSVERASAVLDEAERQLDLALAHGGEMQLDDDAERVVEQPVAQRGSVTEQPAATSEPMAGRSFAEPPAAESPAAESPAAEPPAAESPAAEPPAATDRGDRRANTRASRCARACRALHSMRRAAERLCTLTGQSDDRCGAAQRRLRAAERLVHRACPSCQGR